MVKLHFRALKCMLGASHESDMFSGPRASRSDVKAYVERVAK